jgi:hypothetical protein
MPSPQAVSDAVGDAPCAAALSGWTNAWPGMTAREGPDDPSVVTMEDCGPLKLDKRRTLEGGTGSNGLAAFGLSPPTPPTSVPIGHGRLSRRLKASSRSPPALAELSRGGSGQVGVQK